MTNTEIEKAINRPATASAAHDWERLEELGSSIARVANINERRALYLAWFDARRAVVARCEMVIEPARGLRGGTHYQASWMWDGEAIRCARGRSKKAARKALEFTLKFD